MSKKLVIDTDGVADDVRAISLAIQHPDVEVLAITTVIGCVNVTQATANVARTLRANGLETDSIPIYRGAAEPLIGNNHDPTHEAHFFGEDGIGGKPEEFPSVEYNDFNAAVEDVHAASALIKLFREHKGEAILVCLGPLTNVALALKLEPEFASWPKSVHVMGGNLFGAGNVKSYSTAEFNFSNDPEAAHIVIEKMKVPLTVVPWECFLFPSVDSTVDFHAHLELDAPLAKFFSTATSVGRAALEPSGVQYAYCDEITMASAICPNVILEKRELRGTVELHGSITRGQLALDWTERLWSDVFLASGKFCDKRPKITFVEKYDIPLLDKMIREAVLNSAKPQSE
uniref:IU_nuc_hydro domain-containing protein n=1 Tax=Panagrellus redivivus TaxID=6233 RepID=A0A7E4WBY7_PANRE